MTQPINGNSTNLFVPGGMHDFSLWEMLCGEDGDGTDLGNYSDPEGSGFIPLDALSEEDLPFYESPEEFLERHFSTEEEDWEPGEDPLSLNLPFDLKPEPYEELKASCGTVYMDDEGDCESVPTQATGATLVSTSKDRLRKRSSWAKKAHNFWPSRYRPASDPARERGAKCPKGQKPWQYHADRHNYRRARTSIRKMSIKQVELI